MKKKSFIVYNDIEEPLEDLTDEQVGQIFRAMLTYSRTGEAPELTDTEVKMSFKFIKKQMDANTEKYEEICEKRKAAGKKSAEARAESKSQQKEQKPAKTADNDNENETETENETDINKSSQPTDQKAYNQIAEAWNKIEGVPHIKDVKKSSKRGKALGARIKEYGAPTILEAIDKVKSSDFLTGKNGMWTASFDWFVTPGNIDKILEGNYTNKATIKKQNSFNSFQQRDYDFEELEKKLIWGG